MEKLEKQHPSCLSSVSWNSGISESIFQLHVPRQPEPSAHQRPNRWFLNLQQRLFCPCPERISGCFLPDGQYTSGIFLTLFHHLWFKGRFPILWDLDFHRAISAVYLLAFITVTIIVIVRTLGFLISKMVIHFSLHHFFNRAAQKCVHRSAKSARPAKLSSGSA